MVGAILGAIASSSITVGVAASTPAPVDWNAIIAICTIISVSVLGGGAARTVFKDRRERAVKEAEVKSKEEGRLERVERLLAGDRDTKGLVKEFSEFKVFVERELTMNGGGSLRDEVKLTKTTVGKVASDVTDIKSSQTRQEHERKTREREST